ncbi:MAG: hypothetical protein IPI74_07075 [Bacteroidales bacterium]|nr:hypothetical protein [Bacteroidales bacterium]
MPRGETIAHEGKVLSVPGDGTAEVEILVAGACSGCHAKSVCSAGKSESRIIKRSVTCPSIPVTMSGLR